LQEPQTARRSSHAKSVISVKSDVLFV